MQTIIAQFKQALNLDDLGADDLEMNRTIIFLGNLFGIRQNKLIEPETDLNSKSLQRNKYWP